MPDSSSRPCNAPSSPSLPCRTGNTTSRLTVSHRPCSRTSSPGALLSGDSTAGRQPAFSQFPSGPSQSFQAPPFVIPIQNGSYFPESRFFATSRADLTETGCSSQQPPNMIPTLTLPMSASLLKFQAVDDAVLDDVAQGMVCVIGGMRADNHLRQLLQPQKRLAFNGLAPAVGVEYSFLSFEDIQRRTAQPAAFHCRGKGLRVEKRAASGIDDVRAALHLLDAPTVQEMVRVRVERRMERYDVAQLQQFIEGHVIGSRLGVPVAGQYPAAETPPPVHDCRADAPCPAY